MKNFLFVLIICFIVNLQSYATTWVQVGDYEYIDKDSIEYYIDDRGETHFNKKTFWTKIINNNNQYKETEKTIGKNFSYSIDKSIIDMTNKTFTIKTFTLYDEKGTVIYSDTNRDIQLNWNSIVPDSHGEFLFELVKKPRLLKKMYKYQQIKQSPKNEK